MTEQLKVCYHFVPMFPVCCVLLFVYLKCSFSNLSYWDDFINIWWGRGFLRLQHRLCLQMRWQI